MRISHCKVPWTKAIFYRSLIYFSVHWWIAPIGYKLGILWLHSKIIYNPLIIKRLFGFVPWNELLNGRLRISWLRYLKLGGLIDQKGLLRATDFTWSDNQWLIRAFHFNAQGGLKRILCPKLWRSFLMKWPWKVTVYFDWQESSFRNSIRNCGSWLA